MQQQHIITRRALYDLVWSEPKIKLVKKFEISDTGMRKICINANIPLPAAGYWIKLKFRKRAQDGYRSPKSITATKQLLSDLQAKILKRLKIPGSPE